MNSTAFIVFRTMALKIQNGLRFQGSVAAATSAVGPGLRAPPRRMQPPALPISQPIRSCKLSAAQSQQQKEAVTPTAASPAVTPTMPRKDWREPTAAAAAVATLHEETAVAITEGGEHVKHDLLVWFEILELGEL